jgi:2-polyprenyl-3-methyl-5-hydroxy-6-metoxy-1,4-benzoquinol methylase
MKNISDHTNYTRRTDLKRLSFISETIKSRDMKGGKILDVGCGNGNISHYLGSLGYNVLGIDISEKAIENARKGNQFSNVEFRVLSAEQLREEGEGVDAIVCSEVLEHLTEPQELLQVLNRLLVAGGILIVTVPNGKGPRETLMTRPMQWMKGKDNLLWRITRTVKRLLGYSGTTIQSDADNLDHIQFFSKKSLFRLCKDADFIELNFTKSDFMQDIFPISLLSKRIGLLQQLDCNIADILPHQLVSGFQSSWIKKSDI